MDHCFECGVVEAFHDAQSPSIDYIDWMVLKVFCSFCNTSKTTCSTGFCLLYPTVFAFSAGVWGKILSP